MYGTLNISTPLNFSPETRFGFPVKNHKNKNIICAVSVAAPPQSMLATSSSRGSLYEVLRLEPTATLTEIKTAYRSLAKMYHPDLLSDGGCGHDFIQIHNAYATLSDPAARAVYDLSLVSRTRRRPASSSAVGYSGRSGFYSTRRWETDQCW